MTSTSTSSARHGPRAATFLAALASNPKGFVFREGQKGSGCCWPGLVWVWPCYKGNPTGADFPSRGLLCKIILPFWNPKAIYKLRAELRGLHFKSFFFFFARLSFNINYHTYSVSELNHTHVKPTGHLHTMAGHGITTVLDQNRSIFGHPATYSTQQYSRWSAKHVVF